MAARGNMKKLYIFDQGGVLSLGFDVGPEAARRIGISLAEFRRLADFDMYALLSGHVSCEEYWRRFEKRSGLTIAEDYWETLFNPSLDAATAAIVRELGAHVRVVGGTNTIAPHYAFHLREGHYTCLHKVYASHLMGVAKPCPDFWLQILEAEGVEADEARFFDDMPENIEAARALGIDASLYVSAEGLREELLSRGELPPASKASSTSSMASSGVLAPAVTPTRS